MAEFCSVVRPENVENDDALNGRHVNQLAVHLQPDGLMHIPTGPSEHHLPYTDLKVDAFIV